MEWNSKRVDEVIRYLGYGTEKAGTDVVKMIEECHTELSKAEEPKYYVRRFEIDNPDDDSPVIRAAGIEFKSKSLKRNLAGCREVLFFAATLGNAADRLIERYMKIRMSKGVIMDAVANEHIENYCDECQEEIEKKLKQENMFIRPRFSAGYGDLALEYQSDFVRILDTSRTVGIMLSEGGVMMPLKSVTALMGICTEKSDIKSRGCADCDKRDCGFCRKQPNRLRN